MQQFIDFDAVTDILVPPRISYRELRKMHYENLIQGSILNRELRRQETARLNEEAEAIAAQVMLGLVGKYKITNPEIQELVCQLSDELAEELLKSLNSSLQEIECS